MAVLLLFSSGILMALAVDEKHATPDTAIDKKVCDSAWKKTCDPGFEPESPAVFGMSNSGESPPWLPD